MSRFAKTYPALDIAFSGVYHWRRESVLMVRRRHLTKYLPKGIYE
jgi:hypothetical protein